MSTARATVEAGLLIRGHVRRQIRGRAHALNLTLTLDEERGPLESVFLVHVEGEKNADVLAFTSWLGSFIDSLD